MFDASSVGHYDDEMSVFVLEQRQRESDRYRTAGEKCVFIVLIEEHCDSFCAVLPSRVDHRELFDVAFSESRDTCFDESGDADFATGRVLTMASE